MLLAVVSATIQGGISVADDSATTASEIRSAKDHDATYDFASLSKKIDALTNKVESLQEMVQDLHHREDEAPPHWRPGRPECTGDPVQYTGKDTGCNQFHDDESGCKGHYLEKGNGDG